MASENRTAANRSNAPSCEPYKKENLEATHDKHASTLKTHSPSTSTIATRGYFILVDSAGIDGRQSSRFACRQKWGQIWGGESPGETTKKENRASGQHDVRGRTSHPSSLGDIKEGNRPVPVPIAAWSDVDADADADADDATTNEGVFYPFSSR